LVFENANKRFGGQRKREQEKGKEKEKDKMEPRSQKYNEPSNAKLRRWSLRVEEGEGSRK